MSEKSRPSKKRKHEELDAEYIFQKIANFSSTIREIKRAQRRSTEKISLNRDSTCEKFEKNCCCCCQSACKRFRRDEQNAENSPEDETFIAALKNNETDGDDIVTTSLRDHRPFVNEWIRITKEAFSAEELRSLSAKYKVDENCVSELKAPRLNDGLHSLVDPMVMKIDEAYAKRQNQIAALMSIVAMALAVIVRKGKQSAEVSKLVETLNDIGRCNADIHHAISIARRRSIFAAFNLNNIDDQSNVGEELFSLPMDRLLWQQNLIDTVKKWFASEKEAMEKSLCKTQSIATQTQMSQGTQTQMSQATQTQTEQRTETVQINGMSASTSGTQQQHEVAANIEENRHPTQETEVAKERVVAKIQGRRAAKEEPSTETTMIGVPSAKEPYPGGRELVRRALRLRGVPEKFPNVQDSTWKRYEKHLLSWWIYCQETKTNLALPSPSDVVHFFEKLREVGQSVNDCRAPLRRVIPNDIATHPLVREFYATVKMEKHD